MLYCGRNVKLLTGECVAKEDTFNNGNLEAEIIQGLAALTVQADHDIVSRFTLYVTELERWNARYGFIKADRKGLVHRHLLDALAGLPLLRSLVPAGNTILDFGSGAGFPGLPLAVLMTDRPFVLCERKATERAFLENMALLLRLPHVLVTGDIDRQVKGSLAAVVFRAVMSLKEIQAIVRPYLLPGGLLFAYKGTREKIDREIAEIAPLGLATEVHPLELAGLERERHIVIVRKK
jgi:16S rRNA (guanine527-N7)-methyltransferase